MAANKSQDEIYAMAKQRVEKKKGFFIHVTIYVVVNTVLFVIWNITGVDFPWFAFPLGGWGIGVLFHGLSVFVFSKESNWEREQIKKEMTKLER
jgi:hypothetical protein